MFSFSNTSDGKYSTLQKNGLKHRTLKNRPANVLNAEN